MHILLNELKQTGKGIHFEDRTVPALLFADDVTLLADNKDDFRDLIRVYEDFCIQNHASTNLTKA